jgi:hypothetical protein
MLLSLPARVVKFEAKGKKNSWTYLARRWFQRRAGVKGGNNFAGGVRVSRCGRWIKLRITHYTTVEVTNYAA